MVHSRSERDCGKLMTQVSKLRFRATVAIIQEERSCTGPGHKCSIVRRFNPLTQFVKLRSVHAIQERPFAIGKIISDNQAGATH
jgi:hypothetical protein